MKRRREERGAAPAQLIAPAVLLAVLSLTATIVAPILDVHGDLYTEVVRSVVVAAFAVAGSIALVQRPSERQPLLVLVSAALGGIATVFSALIQAHAHGTSVGPSLLSGAHFLEPLALALLPVAAMHLLLGLPDGSCRLSRTVIVGGYLVGAAVGIVLWTRRPALPLWPVGVELLVALPVGLVGVQRRYARSAGLERQRMQWFGWAVAVGAEMLLVALALRLLWGWPTRAPLVVAVSSIPIAVAFGMGSLRHFAGRIDRILAHTVSIAGLTGVVVVVYLVVVLGLGHTPTHPERTLLALSMAAAAVAALLYGPARERLGQYANRIVYGEREAPDAVLRTFGSRLSRAIPMDELLLQVAESLRKTLALSAAEVWTGSGGVLERSISVPDRPSAQLKLGPKEESVVARAGVTGTAWLEVWLPGLLVGREHAIMRVAPATHSGQVLGLIVGVRPENGDQFTDDHDTMLTELARQVGLALHNVELDSALQASLNEVRRQAEELQASRARIVAASDAARRQIERNLHDGAQQHLVALAVNVRLARKLAETDPRASAEILDQLGEGLQDAVQELRGARPRHLPTPSHRPWDRRGVAIGCLTGRPADRGDGLGDRALLPRRGGCRLLLLHGGPPERGQARGNRCDRHGEGVGLGGNSLLRGGGHRGRLRQERDEGQGRRLRQHERPRRGHRRLHVGVVGSRRGNQGDGTGTRQPVRRVPASPAQTRSRTSGPNSSLCT